MKYNEKRMNPISFKFDKRDMELGVFLVLEMCH